jgi:hypothetical protein
MFPLRAAQVRHKTANNVIRVEVTDLSGQGFDNGELAVLVRDYCSGSPQPGDAGTDDEDGRGLVVRAMSGRTGWYRVGDGCPGKILWAVLPALVPSPSVPVRAPRRPRARCPRTHR